MNNSEWIPLSTIQDDEIIWVGTRVRIYNVGINVKYKEDDYNDFMLTAIYGNAELLQLVNMSQGEAGNILCVLEKDLPNHYALGKTLKYMVGLQNTYVLFE